MIRQTLVALVAALGAIGMAGASDKRYDKELARAAARIAAERMGDLRGSLSSQEKLDFVESRVAAPAPETDEAAGMRPGVWVDGLAIAVERRSTVSPEL